MSRQARQRVTVDDLPYEILEEIFETAISQDHWKSVDLSTVLNIICTCKRWADLAWKFKFRLVRDWDRNFIFRKIVDHDTSLPRSRRDKTAYGKRSTVPGEQNALWADHCHHLQLAEIYHGVGCECTFTDAHRQFRRGPPCDVDQLINGLPRFRAVSHLEITVLLERVGKWERYFKAMKWMPKLRVLRLKCWMDANSWHLWGTPADGYSRNARPILEGDSNTCTIENLILESFDLRKLQGLTKCQNRFRNIKQLSLIACLITVREVETVLHHFERLEAFHFDCRHHLVREGGDNELLSDFNKVLAPHTESLRSLVFDSGHRARWQMRWLDVTALNSVVFDIDDFQLREDPEALQQQFKGSKLSRIQLNYTCGSPTSEGSLAMARKFGRSDVDHIIAIAKAVRYAKYAGTIDAIARSGEVSPPKLIVVVNLEKFIYEDAAEEYACDAVHPALSGWDPSNMPWDMLDRAHEELERFGITLSYILPPGPRSDWVDIVETLRAVCRGIDCGIVEHQSQGRDDRRHEPEAISQEEGKRRRQQQYRRISRLYGHDDYIYISEESDDGHDDDDTF